MNELALYDAVRRKAWDRDQKIGEPENTRFLVRELEKIGRVFGLSSEEISDALDSDRMLVIYEP